MNWKEYYKQHLMSAEDAVNHIQSGNRVVVAHACEICLGRSEGYEKTDIISRRMIL